MSISKYQFLHTFQKYAFKHEPYSESFQNPRPTLKLFKVQKMMILSKKGIPVCELLLRENYA